MLIGRVLCDCPGFGKWHSNTDALAARNPVGRYDALIPAPVATVQDDSLGFKLGLLDENFLDGPVWQPDAEYPISERNRIDLVRCFHERNLLVKDF